jgi:hypothetical protein
LLLHRSKLNIGRGRETKRFPVAEILKPQGFKAQMNYECNSLSSEIPTGGQDKRLLLKFFYFVHIIKTL